MHQQNGGRVAWAFIDVSDAQAADLGVMGPVGKVGQVGKARFWGAQHLGDTGQVLHGQKRRLNLMSVDAAGRLTKSPSAPMRMGPL